MTNADHSEKLSLALKEGQMAGLSLAAMFPPFLRGLSRLGLPVRPLHYMSAPALLAFAAVGLSVIFALIFSGAMMLDQPPRLIRRIADNGGLPLVVMLALIVGALTAVIVRFQALSKDLTSWRDL